MGEEFLVLDGVFSDESGDYPRGSYVRNPPGTGHAPYSDEGCRILVKLRQFDAGDTRQFAIDTMASNDWQPLSGSNAEQLALHQFGRERVCLLRLPAGVPLPLNAHGGGLELFVVSGTVQAGESVLPEESWLRLPPGSGAAVAAVADALLWIKTGHLPPAEAAAD